MTRAYAINERSMKRSKKENNEGANLPAFKPLFFLRNLAFFGLPTVAPATDLA
jgi:hypothetical protein